MSQSKSALSFTCKALPGTVFTVARFEGVEEISRPYWFRIDLVSDDPELDLREPLDAEALLTIRHGGETREIAGVVSEFEQCQELPDHRYLYRALLVPRLSLLGIGRQCQIYGTAEKVTIADVIENEFKEDDRKGLESIDRKLRKPIDYDLRISREYPERDYIVQYDESDLDFLSRLMEHRGIFYFFEVKDGRDVVVVGDEGFAFAVADKEPIDYRPPSGMAPPAAHAVHRFSCRARMLPGKVTLRDYNYRLPHVSLIAEEAVDTAGHGIVVRYGDHFRTPEEGARLAKLRAEQQRCEGEIYVGAGDCLAFSAGHRFTLASHYRSAFNQGYLLVKVRHSGGQSVPGLDLGGAADAKLGYRNEFEAIDGGVPYRPSLRTRKPVMPGIINAHVDAEGPGNRAEIDEDGRYKVVLPFDLSRSAGGKASRFMRKAEPYGGARGGMHFPLLKDTEVLLACVGGDPDRPVILGAVPNPRNRSVSNNVSRDRNRIQTTSGILMEFADGLTDGDDEPAAGTGEADRLAPQQQTQSVAADDGQAEATPPPAADGDAATPGGAGDSRANWWRLYVPHAKGGEDTGLRSYLRLGMPPRTGAEASGTLEPALRDAMAEPTREATGFEPKWRARGHEGLLVYTEGDRAGFAARSSFDAVGGDARRHVGGGEWVWIDGDRETRIGGKAARAIAVSQHVEIGEPGAAPAGGKGDKAKKTDKVDEAGVVDTLLVHGDRKVTIDGGETRTVKGDKSEKVDGGKSTVVKGEKKDTYLGATKVVNKGYATDIYASGKASISFSQSIGLSFSHKLEASFSSSQTIKVGALDFTLAGGLDFKINTSISFGLELGSGVKASLSGTKVSILGVELKKKTLEVKSKTAKVEMTEGADVEVATNKTIM